MKGGCSFLPVAEGERHCVRDAKEQANEKLTAPSIDLLDNPIRLVSDSEASAVLVASETDCAFQLAWRRRRRAFEFLLQALLDVEDDALPVRPGSRADALARLSEAVLVIRLKTEPARSRFTLEELQTRL